MKWGEGVSIKVNDKSMASKPHTPSEQGSAKDGRRVMQSETDFDTSSVSSEWPCRTWPWPPP